MEHWKIAFIWGVYAFHFFSAPLIIQMWNILPRLQTLYIGRLFFFQFIYFVRYRTQRFSYEVNFFPPLANRAALARVIGSHMSSFLKLKSNNNLLAISIHLAGFFCARWFSLYLIRTCSPHSSLAISTEGEENCEKIQSKFIGGWCLARILSLFEIVNWDNRGASIIQRIDSQSQQNPIKPNEQWFLFVFPIFSVFNDCIGLVWIALSAAMHNLTD